MGKVQKNVLRDQFKEMFAARDLTGHAGSVHPSAFNSSIASSMQVMP